MKIQLKIGFIILSLAINLPVLASAEFISAVKQGELDVVEDYLQGGINVNYASADGTTALHWAAYHNNTGLVSRLLRENPKVNVNNEYGSSPMYEAAENTNVEIIKQLLDAGADVESANLEGQTALMTVARAGNVEAAMLLLDAGANVNHQEEWQGQTALMWASAQRQPAMVALLLNNGADANIVSKTRVWKRRVTAEPRPQRRPPGGWTALAFAARQGCAACIKALVDGGADLDQVSPEGITALLMATLNGRFNTAAALIEAGADVNKWDIWGRSPLYSVVDFKTIPTGGRADRPSLDVTTALEIIDMLLTAGANPNVQLKLFPPYRDLGADRGADNFLTIGTTPLIRAAKAGDIESVQHLLKYAALVDLPTSQGITALIAASGEGSGVVDVRARYMHQEKNVEVASLLIAAGADVNAQRDNGKAALHGAASKGWNSFIRLLVEAQVDINLIDNNGFTALDTALGRAFVPGFFGRRTPEIFADTGALLVELGALE